MSFYKSLKNVAAFASVALVLVTVSSCGGSSGGGSSEEGDAVTTDSAQEVSTTSAAVGGSASSATSSATSSSENTAQLIKLAVKNHIRTTTTSATETLSESTECEISGTVDLEGSLTVSVDDSTGEYAIDGDLTNTLNACTETTTIELSDGSCTFESTVDGEMSCVMTGSFSESAGIDFEMACTTSDTCEGVELTFNGETHTIGVDISVAISGDVDDEDFEPTLTGTFCVDDTVFDINDFETTDFSTTDFSCDA